MATVGIFPFKENSHGRAGNRTRDLMISSQRPRGWSEKQYLMHILSGRCRFFFYQAYKAHAPYCHLLTDRLYFIFSHYLINGTIFREKSLMIKCVFRFCVQLLSEIFLILRRIQRNMIKNVYRSSCKVPVILVRF